MVSNKPKIPVLVIFGPTAIGKTALSVTLFGKRSLFFKDRAEIINADSMSVYRHCSIATAKPTDLERSLIPYHLLDIRDPDEQYTASDFVKDADMLCHEIYSRGKLPVITGGTGFYIKSFLYGTACTPAADTVIREYLSNRMKAEGAGALYFELSAVDPVSAAKINSNDAYRIQRALEVFYATGMPRSSFEIPEKLRSEYLFTVVVLETALHELYRRIDARVDTMFHEGLVEEYQSLRASGYAVENPRSPALQAIGYRELLAAEKAGYSELSLVAAAQQIKINSHHYARKQKNYMCGIPDLNIVSGDNEREIVRIVSLLLDETGPFGNNKATF